MNVNNLITNLDSIDLDIISLSVQEKSNQDISQELKIPLSTIQRRVRKILEIKVVISKTELNYGLLGYKTGLVHVYLRNGNINEVANKIYSIKGVILIEIHIGNSDILGHVIYKEGKDLLYIISEIKKINDVEQVVWSEKIYQSPIKEFGHIESLKKGETLRLI